MIRKKPAPHAMRGGCRLPAAANLPDVAKFVEGVKSRRNPPPINLAPTDNLTANVPKRLEKNRRLPRGACLGSNARLVARTLRIAVEHDGSAA
jgi:hypothetical protein